MAKSTLEKRLIRYKDLMPCKAAFIDAKTPGSHLKDNYSIIGGGVSESKHQKVNLKELHGFCIGAAGQPPRIKNSPHSHFTAEVFMVYRGAWRFYGTMMKKGKRFYILGILFHYQPICLEGLKMLVMNMGMMFSILGHDDAGGGVVWAPRVIEEAKGHGLILLENGKLVDTTKGEKIPTGLKPKRKLSKAQLKKFDQYTGKQMSAHVGRVGTYKSSIYKGFPNQSPKTLQWIDVLGPKDSKGHNFQVKPGDPNGEGFNVYGLQSDSKGKTGKFKRDE